MKNLWIYAITLLSLLVLHTASFALDSLRCGSRIVTIGEPRASVRAKCGEPADKEVRYEKRIARDFYRDLFPPRGYERQREREKYREPLFVEVFVEIEEWTYNLGPTSFIRYLTFENGRLVSIETGDYGY